VDSGCSRFYLYELKDDGTYYLIDAMSFRDARDWYTDSKRIIMYMFENLFQATFETVDKKPFLVRYNTVLFYTIPDEYGEWILSMKKFLVSLVDRKQFRPSDAPDLSKLKLFKVMQLLEKKKYFTLVRDKKYYEASEVLKEIMSVEAI